MARNLYEGNTALNFETYLSPYGFAKSELNSALKQMTLTGTRIPATRRIVLDGNLFDFKLPGAEIDSTLAVLDRTGDLRFLDHIHDLITHAHTSLKTTFQLMPNGTKAKVWVDNPTWIQTGRRRWNCSWTEFAEGIPDPDYYGTDLSYPDVWTWHSVYANAALAFKNNVGKVSPRGLDYSAMWVLMRDYLTVDFEPLWIARGLKKTIGTATVINIPSTLHRTVVARTRYHRAMYQALGRDYDNTQAANAAGWAAAGFEFKEHLGKKLVYWGVQNTAGLNDVGGLDSAPYPFEVTRLASLTITPCYHLRLMGQTGFNDELLTAFANTLYYSIFIDGADFPPASDVGGGGPTTLGLTIPKRQFAKIRDGSLIPSRFYLVEYGGVALSRWNSEEMMHYAIGIVLGHGNSTLASQYFTLRDKFDNPATSLYFNDKVALGLWHLTKNNWRRDIEGELPNPVEPVPPTNPEDGGGEGPTDPEIPTDPGTPPQPALPLPEEPVEYKDTIPPVVGETTFKRPQKLVSVGLIVYDKNWGILDRVIPGLAQNPIIKTQFTLEPNGKSGLCKSATLTISRYLNVPPLANIQILINGIPRFMGKVSKPPQPRVRRFSKAGDPITLRMKDVLVSSRTGTAVKSSNQIDTLEAVRGRVKEAFEFNPGNPLAGETEEYQELINYDIEGLKSLTERTYLFRKTFENKTISDIVKEIAAEFCLKHEIIYDPNLISQIDYNTVKQEFDTTTVLSALDSLAQLAGNIAWGIDAYGRFFFLRRGQAPSHFYFLDTDPVELSGLEVSADQLTNAIVVTGSSFGSSGKEVRTGYIEDVVSIQHYGRYESVYTYPSAVSEVGVPANVAAMILSKPKPVSTYDKAPSSTPLPGNLPDEEYIMGIENEINIRDGDFASYALLPGNSADGVPQLIQNTDIPSFWTLDLYFEPQFANSLTLWQGETDDVAPVGPETDGIGTPDGKYLATGNDRYVARRLGSGKTVNAMLVYNNGQKIWSRSGLGNKVTMEFNKQLVTQITIVLLGKPSSGKWLLREANLLLAGKNDLERYAESSLIYSSKPVISASFAYPPDMYFDPPGGVRITDFNSLTSDYEVSEVTYKIEGGLTVSGKIGRGQINLANLLAIQKRASEAADKRSKLIDDELERRVRVAVDYTSKLVSGQPVRIESWMDGTALTRTDRDTAQPEQSAEDAALLAERLRRLKEAAYRRG